MAASFQWSWVIPPQTHREVPGICGPHEARLGPFPALMTQRESAIVERFHALATAQGFAVERRVSDNGSGALLFVARRVSA